MSLYETICDIRFLSFEYFVAYGLIYKENYQFDIIFVLGIQIILKEVVGLANSSHMFVLFNMRVMIALMVKEKLRKYWYAYNLNLEDL